MSPTLTLSQRVARESFKNVILNEGGFYPDDVRIVPLDGMTVERMADLMYDHVIEGTAIVFVRQDGREFVMEKQERNGMGALVDRLLRRVRVQITALQPTPETAHFVHRREERYVHPNHVRDLRDLSGHLVTCS
ncbi:MAG TPA: hypothetical protein VIL49_16635 [Capillimicrobium sp.]|jgi:hypothetical protein